MHCLVIAMVNFPAQNQWLMGAFHRIDYTTDPPRDVAIKLMNLDDVDYEVNTVDKDDTLNDIRKEVRVLMQLKDHGVQNVNLILDVLEIDGLLWLVCEYCPGGSLKTLVSIPLILLLLLGRRWWPHA